jgi:hypothetical protein
MDYTALLYSPIYDVLGVPADLTPNRPEPPTVSVVVIDKTAGVDISGAMDVMSLRPAAVVRTQDLAAAGVSTSELDGGTLRFSGQTWRIDMHHARPSPDGLLSGEVMMILLDERTYG